MFSFIRKDRRKENEDVSKCKKIFLYPPHYPYKKGHPIQVYYYQGTLVEIPAPEVRNKDATEPTRHLSITSLVDLESVRSC